MPSGRRIGQPLFDSAIENVLCDLANARDDQPAAPNRSTWWAVNTSVNRGSVLASRTTVSCRVCDKTIDTNSRDYVDTELLVRHGKQHRDAARYMLDHNLVVLRSQVTFDQIIVKGWSELSREEVLARIGVVQVCKVVVVPQWVADVFNTPFLDKIGRLRVLRLAAADELFQDALIASSALPDSEGVSTFLASQFWEELPR